MKNDCVELDMRIGTLCRIHFKQRDVTAIAVLAECRLPNHYDDMGDIVGDVEEGDLVIIVSDETREDEWSCENLLAVTRLGLAWVDIEVLEEVK